MKASELPLGAPGCRSMAHPEGMKNDRVGRAAASVAWLAIVVLYSSFAASASAQSVTDRLRGCLAIENMTKARLDCYDAIAPPVIKDCRFYKKEDERLICFNQFLELPTKPTTSVIAPVASKPAASKQPSAKKTRGNKGCSLPGLHHLPNGKCSSREE
jgi:hypothetical protein